MFSSREDAEWVAYQEKEIAKRIASRSSGTEREKWQRYAKQVGVMELLSFGMVASPNVEALQRAEREMKKTGYFPAKKTVRKWIAEESNQEVR